MLSYFISVSLIFVFIFFFWFILGVFSNKNLFKFHNKKFPIFNLRNESLWEDLKTGRNEPTGYQIYFLGRRLSTAVTIVIPPQFNIPPIFQYQFLMYLNIFFAAKVKVDKPYSKESINVMEFMNECYLLLVVYLLHSMSVEPHTGPAKAVIKNQIGVYTNSAIIALFACNLLYLAGSNF